MRTPAGLSPLETAAGFAVGWARGPRVRSFGAPPPLAALELAIEPYLRRPPCLVAFSGGRDSSLVLAAACRAARRIGVEAPVAVTLRYPQVPEANEPEWQELVVNDLRPADWVVIDVEEDLDLIGPVARRALLEHGPLFPANIFTALPLIEQAAGGSLVFGTGGDELLDRLRWAHVRDVLAQRRPPEPRDAARLAGAALPRRLRALLATDAGVVAGQLGWLRESARHELWALERAEAAEPVRWPRAVRWAGEHRGVLLVADALGRLAANAHVAVGLPMLDPSFIAALARAGGATGWRDRTEAMRVIAGGVLPDGILARRGKAIFNRTLFGARSREFAESWSGEGLDEEIVDPEALRSAWLAPMPDFRSALLLQVAWLHDRVLTESAPGHAEARLQGVV